MRPGMPHSMRATSEECHSQSNRHMLLSQTSMGPTTREWWKGDDLRKMHPVGKESHQLYQLISKSQKDSTRNAQAQMRESEVAQKWVNLAKMRCIRKQVVLLSWHLRLNLHRKKFLCVIQRIKRPEKCVHRRLVKTWVRSVWSESKSRRILPVLKFQWPETAPQRCWPIKGRPMLVRSPLMSSNSEIWLEVSRATNMLATNAPVMPMTAWSHPSLSGLHNPHHVASYP